MPPVVNFLTVDESGHVLANPAPIIEDVAASPLVFTKVIVENFAKRRACGFECRTHDVPLNVSSETHGSHEREL